MDVWHYAPITQQPDNK